MKKPNMDFKFIFFPNQERPVMDRSLIDRSNQDYIHPHTQSQEFNQNNQYEEPPM